MATIDFTEEERQNLKVCIVLASGETISNLDIPSDPFYVPGFLAFYEKEVLPNTTKCLTFISLNKVSGFTFYLQGD